MKFGAKLQFFFETAKELRQNMHAVPSVFLLVCYATCVQETTGETVLLVPPLFSLLSAVRTVRCGHHHLSNRTKSFRPVEVERKSLFVGTDLVYVRTSKCYSISASNENPVQKRPALGSAACYRRDARKAKKHLAQGIALGTSRCRHSP